MSTGSIKPGCLFPPVMNSNEAKYWGLIRCFNSSYYYVNDVICKIVHLFLSSTDIGEVIWEVGRVCMVTVDETSPPCKMSLKLGWVGAPHEIQCHQRETVRSVFLSSTLSSRFTVSMPLLQCLLSVLLGVWDFWIRLCE